jgi:chaperonin GroES
MARHHLRPLFDRVVIKELEPDRMRKSGLVVPAGSHEPPPQHGIVLAVGQGVA